MKRKRGKTWLGEKKRAERSSKKTKRAGKALSNQKTADEALLHYLDAIVVLGGR